MSKRPIRGESPSTAHKRQGLAPQDEDPLPSASASLAQQASSLPIPKIPIHLIAELILPFVANRTTWNSVCSASNELCLAAKKMTPPWPNKAFSLGSNVQVRHLAFSPSGSQLAFGTKNYNTDRYVIHVWDRWGKETLLGGHTRATHCLGLIRIWRRESLLTTTSTPYMERPIRTPDTILLGSRNDNDGIIALSFSQTDSNLLASEEHNEIKVWNVKKQACIHTFDSGGSVGSLFFAGGADIACLALTRALSIIRIWRAEGSSDFASETIGEADPGGLSLPNALFSPSGSFLATSFVSTIRNESTIALYETETMTKTQSVVMIGFTATHIAVSPDSKHVVVGGPTGRIRLLQTDDLSIQRDLDPRGESTAMLVSSVAFDPTCRVLAIGYRDGGIELRTL